MKIKVLIICILFLSGCVYYPWEKTSYTVVNGPTLKFPRRLNSLGKYKDHTVNGIVFKLFIKADNETLTAGSAPYVIYFNAFTDDDESQIISIKKIKVFGGNQKVFNVDNDSLPKILNFRPYAPINKMLISSHQFNTLFNFDKNIDKKIYVQVTVEVGTNKSRTIKTLNYMFKSSYKKGSFINLTA